MLIRKRLLITIPLVNQKVKAIVCLGENVDSIKAAFENLDVDMLFASSMEEAVNQSYEHAIRAMLFCYRQHVLVSIYSKIMSTEVMNLNHQ